MDAEFSILKKFFNIQSFKGAVNGDIECYIYKYDYCRSYI